MRRLLVGPRGLVLVATLALSLFPSSGRAEPPKPQKVIFSTFDKVDIQGTFYASTADGTKSPCVIFLHKIGGNREQDGWETLAQGLQEKGFCVLSFDFRGHGDSTNVRPEFWNNRSNVNGMPKAPRKDTIDAKNFLPTYYPMLVNDIAAAKLFLEQKNQAKECNAGDLYVVGAEEGASLGLIWLASEWGRRKRGYGPTGQMTLYPDPEGKEVAAFVALSIRPTLAPKIALPMATLFKNPKMADTPMCFFVGKTDKTGSTCTNQIYDQYLKADKNKLKYTYRIEFENTNLAGHDLLKQKSLAVDELVIKYMADKIKEGRPARVWADRDVPTEGRPSLNPLQAIALNQLGFNVP